MKFSISSERFKKIISLAARICGSNTTLPILNNIFISAKKNLLLVSSTNLELGFLISLPIKTEKEGEIAVPGKTLSELASSLPKEEIKIEEENSIIKLQCAGFKAKILGQNPRDFPTLPEVKEKNIIEIQTPELVYAFSVVNHIISPSDVRVEISGVLVKIGKENINLVGTDSIRLAEKTVKLGTDSIKNHKPKAIIIPQKTTTEFIYAFSGLGGKTGIAVEPSQVAFNFIPKDPTEPQITLISRLIEGEYPEYGEIIPKETKLLAVLDKEELQKKIKTTSLFSSRIQDIKLKFQPSSSSLIISASSTEVGEATSEIKGKVEGESVEATFNWKYLLDGLSAISSSEVFLGVNNSTSPMVLKPVGDQTYFYILMPKTV